MKPSRWTPANTGPPPKGKPGWGGRELRQSILEFFMGLLCSRHSHFCKLFQPLHRPWRFFFLKKSVSQCASASEIIIASVVRLVVVEHVPSECPLHPVGLGLLRKSPWSLAPQGFLLDTKKGPLSGSQVLGLVTVTFFC